MTKNLLITFLLIYVLPAFSTECPPLLERVDQIEQRLQDVVKGNEFKRERDLSDYKRFLSDEFFNDLAGLTNRDHVIDGGAGEARAMRDIFEPEMQKVARDVDAQMKKWGLTRKQIIQINDEITASQKLRNRPLVDKPRVTAISLVNTVPEEELPPASHFRLIKGRFFHQISDEEIISRFGKASMIIDQWGIFAYDAQPDVVLARYLKLLRPNGVIYLQVGRVSKTGSTLFNHDVELRGGRHLSLVDWVMHTAGLDIRMANGSDPDFKVLRIKKKSETVEIGELELIAIHETNSPPYQRNFREKP